MKTGDTVYVPARIADIPDNPNNSPRVAVAFETPGAGEPYVVWVDRKHVIDSKQIQRTGNEDRRKI